MPTDKEVFESIVTGVFSAEELAELENPSLPFAVEPVNPSRQELLELLDSVFDALLEMKVGQAWGSLKDSVLNEFANQLIPNLKLHFGEETLIRGAQSFMTEGQGLSALDGSASLYGDFLSMDIRPWYDIPLTDDASEYSRFYEKDNGLHMVLAASRIEYIDGTVDFLGNITVPLNHGNPELFRVLRPQ